MQNFDDMKHLVLILTLFLVLPLTGSAKKRALLVGISKYRANGRAAWVNIHGKEDVDSLAPALTNKGFLVTTLVNDQATYQGIVTSLKGLISDTKKGDIVFIHFSCHGQPVEDGLLKGYPKDEKDGYDEAIVPIDAGKEYSPNGYKGEKHLIDDELNGYIKSLRTKIGPKGMLYITIDACHAGESSRKGIETVRGTNEALTSQASTKYNPPRDTIRHYNVEKAPNLSPVLFIEACKARERNTEIRIKGKEFGSLSYNIWHTLNQMSSFDKKSKDKFKANVEASTKVKGHWPRTQTLVIEE
ncbi:Caspase domain-containing protein [Prevotella communis]|uniref:Caspase domain-containing protein n=2 Tax=Prevotella communis TaxID=2913614 RepID=A0A1G7WA47_9BACT|nr:Caspase domain-containing protein [Prevotella communis]